MEDLLGGGFADYKQYHLQRLRKEEQAFRLNSEFEAGSLHKILSQTNKTKSKKGKQKEKKSNELWQLRDEIALAGDPSSVPNAQIRGPEGILGTGGFCALICT